MMSPLSEGRQVHDFNMDWQFHLGEVPKGETATFDDSAWRSLRLPHDWSAEASFDEPRDRATGQLPGGIGWYRKRLSTPPAAVTKCIHLCFDGICNNAEIRLNGTGIGEHPRGHSSFHCEISASLNPADEVTIHARSEGLQSAAVPLAVDQPGVVLHR